LFQSGRAGRAQRSPPGPAQTVVSRMPPMTPDQALRLAEVQFGLANALRESGQYDGAIGAYRRAITLKLQPDQAEAHAHYYLGNLLANRGLIEEAVTCLSRATALAPDSSELASNLLYALHFHPDSDAQSLLAEHRQWEARFARPLARNV